MTLIGVATFVRLPKLAHALEALANGREIHLDVERLAYIDDSCLDLIRSWKDQYEASGGRIVVEWADMEKRFAPIHSSPVLERPTGAAYSTIRDTSVTARQGLTPHE